jgi:HEXXH motif-containing protein
MTHSSGTAQTAVRPRPHAEPLTRLAVADPGHDGYYDNFASRLQSAVPRVVDLLSPHLTDELRDHVIRCRALYGSLPPAARRRTVTHPLFHFFWLRLMEACRDGDLGRVRRKVADLGRFLVVPLLRHGGLTGEPLPVVVRDGELRFPGHPRHIAHDGAGVRAEGRVSVAGDDLVVAAGGVTTRVPLDVLMGDAVPPAGSAVRVRAYIPGTAIELDGGDPYVAQLFASMNASPRAPGDLVRDLVPITTTDERTVRAFGAAYALLDTAWPEIIPELNAYTRMVVPFQSATHSTFTENAMLGAVFMAESRQPFSSAMYTAEHLLHESSHLRLALVMEIDPLYEAAAETRLHSPFRGTERPVYGLVQGAFVFARIACFLRRAYAATGDEAFRARHREAREDLRTSLETLTGTPEVTFTELGTALMDDLATEAEEGVETR